MKSAVFRCVYILVRRRAHPVESVSCNIWVQGFRSLKVSREKRFFYFQTKITLNCSTAIWRPLFGTIGEWISLEKIWFLSPIQKGDQIFEQLTYGSEILHRWSSYSAPQSDRQKIEKCSGYVKRPFKYLKCESTNFNKSTIKKGRIRL